MVDSLISNRSTNSAPKPNTRFLKSIIKETDSHNAALRAKEAQESRVRPRSFRKDEQRDSRKNLDHGTSRVEDDVHRSKRRRVESNAHSEAARSRRDKNARQQNQQDYHISNGRKHHHTDQDPNDRYDRKVRRSDRERDHHSRHRRCVRSSISPELLDGRLSRSRTRSPHYEPKLRYVHDHRDRRRRDSSSSKPRHKNYVFSKPEHRINTPEDFNSKARRGSRDRSFSPSSDSDPLESIIGPPPPPPEPKVRPRGRGALTATTTSAIDAHFTSNYDPANDAHPDPDLELDDWDQALEALHDRRKWQQQGAERLRAAGFSEDEVAKWASGKKGSLGTEKGEEDVRWKGRGEGREWDRGKVVTDDGVETGAEWGRLKGS